MAVEVLRITDESSGAIASIAPALGFNCFSFQAPCGERLVETLWAHPELPWEHNVPRAADSDFVPSLAGFPACRSSSREPRTS